MYYDKDWSWDNLTAPLKLPEPLPVNSPLWGDKSTSKNGFNSQMGTWFDEAIDLRDPKCDSIIPNVIPLIAKVDARKRKISRLSYDNRVTLVRKLIANGIRCRLHRDPAWVAYFRKADGYRNKPRWLSGEAMRRTIGLLTHSGLVETNLGSIGTSSTYRITERLWAIALESGISESSLVINLPPERLIRLYKRKERKGGDDYRPNKRKRGRELVDFDPTPDTRRWMDLLQAYNAFIGQQDIAAKLTEQEEADCVEHLNIKLEQYIREGGTPAMPYKRPELLRTDLSRVFSNNSFDEGGRLYGGWWINFPKSLRKKITINGQNTIEYDYSGCAIRMLYHERGIDYLDDPYFLKPIADLARKRGLPEDHFRDGIKDMIQAAINEDNPEKHPEQITLEGMTFLPEFKRPEVYAMFREKHGPIADAFRTGAGLRLQKSESDLVLEIITSLKDEGVPALPIHDSIRVPEGDRLLLEDRMINNYNHKYGFKPILSLS